MIQTTSWAVSYFSWQCLCVSQEAAQGTQNLYAVPGVYFFHRKSSLVLEDVGQYYYGLKTMKQSTELSEISDKGSCYGKFKTTK